MNKRRLAPLSTGERVAVYGIGGLIALAVGLVFAAAAGDFRDRDCLRAGLSAGNCSDAQSVMTITGTVLLVIVAGLASVMFFDRRLRR